MSSEGWRVLPLDLMYQQEPQITSVIRIQNKTLSFSNILTSLSLVFLKYNEKMNAHSKNSTLNIISYFIKSNLKQECDVLF